MKDIFFIITILIAIFLSSSAYAATITKTIGTDSRDYSTITLWEDDLDDGTNAANDPTAYQAGDDAVGEMYNDSVFDESVDIDGGGTVGLASVTLTVAEGERHDGTAGTGARIVRTAAGFVATDVSLTGCNVDIKWLEINANGTSYNNGQVMVLGEVYTPVATIANMIIYNQDGGTSWDYVSAVYGGSAVNILNNIIYNHGTSNTGVRTAIGIRLYVNRTTFILNNTIHNIWNNAGSGATYCVEIKDSYDFFTYKNIIATDPSGTTSGDKLCFSKTVLSKTTGSHNLSSDATAPYSSGQDGTVLINKSSADQFVSTVEGSEDLHLKAGADAIDAGTDLSGTGIEGIEIDIDGQDRNVVGGDVWDIGADEYVAVIADMILRIKQEVRFKGEVRVK